MTENQIRAWLEIKLTNYLWKIKGRNSYGSRKRLETIVKDLTIILENLEKYIRNIKDGKNKKKKN